MSYWLKVEDVLSVPPRRHFWFAHASRVHPAHRAFVVFCWKSGFLIKQAFFFFFFMKILKSFFPLNRSSNFWKKFWIKAIFFFFFPKRTTMSHPGEVLSMFVGGTTPVTSMFRNAALYKRIWGSWWASWAWASNVSSQQRRLMHSWTALRGVLLGGQGRWSIPSTQHGWGHTWSAMSHYEHPCIREI